MPRRVKGPDGIVHLFPDDATDAEVAAALDASSPAPTKPEPRMSAAFPGSAHPADTPIGESAYTRDVMNTPLARPTGIEFIDSFTSPTSILGIVGPTALRTAGRVAGAIPRPSGAQVLQAAKFIRHPVRESVKMGADAIISHLDEAAARQATAPPIASPAASQPAVASVQATAPVTKAVFNPSDALKAAKEAFAALGEAPRPAEASNAMEFIRRGTSPAEAVAKVIAKRPALSPAEELAAKLGTLSDAEVRAALDLRNARGEIKSPSAETARARKGR